ncbi:MAG: hypothetical protein AAF281_05245, partial [Pseudomonadota bacterium]
EISAQRVAYGDVVPEAPRPDRSAPAPAGLPGWPALLAALPVFFGGLALVMHGRGDFGPAALRRFPSLDPLARALTAASRRDDAHGTRRVAAALVRRDGPTAQRTALLRGLDRALFAPGPPKPDLRTFARAFLKRPG